MKSTDILIAMVVVFLLLAPAALAQSPGSANQSAVSPAASAAEVPRLIKFSGTLLDAQDRPMTGPVGVTFALHAQQTGGAALWLETQNVTPDARGLYTVLLGANSANGVPAELFTSGEARWLAMQVERQAEQPRVLLVSVPYALKAADAESLGGLPASAFVLAVPSSTASGTSVSGTTTQTTAGKTAAGGKAKTSAPATAIAANFIPVFTDNTGTLGSSAMFQSGGFIGVGTTSPAAPLHVNGNTLLVTSATTAQLQFAGVASEARFGQDGNGAFFASDSPGLAVRFYTNNGTLNEGLRIDSSSNVGIGTSSPAAKLDVVGTGRFTGNTTAVGSAIVGATQTGLGISNADFNNLPPAAVFGDATNATGFTAGVIGRSQSAPGGGVIGIATGVVTGSDRATGVLAVATATSGRQSGIDVTVNSTDTTNVVAGRFSNAGSTAGLVIEGRGPGGTGCGTPPCENTVFTVDGAGNTMIAGNLNVTGTKSSVAQLSDGRVVALYAVESPENWYEDFGTVRLSHGVARVLIDPTFAQTTNTELVYKVFLSPNGKCQGLYVAKKTATEFEVRELRHGKSNVAFDYRIVARRRGYESVRLKEVSH